jgi:hypothetical protein
MRAIYYFEMAKRYGGVPLVAIVLDPQAPIEENMLPRNTEEEVFSFIEEEIDKAINLLTSDATSKDKFNKQIAYAYKARTMLWAASIAKYSQIQLNGLVGLSSSKTNIYYNLALAAAEEVINSGAYSLYNKYPDDKIENYRNIFLDEGNSEVILQKAYNGSEIAHRYDNQNTPPSFRSTYGGRCNPTWEMILSYENVDGSTVQPLLGEDHLYANCYELLKKKDPRLHATIIYQGTDWQGSFVDTYEGIDPNDIPNPDNILSTFGESYNEIPQIGKDYQPGFDGSTKTGFYIKKYMDESIVKPGENISKTNWIEIRLAEMYLIAAEAAFEIGNKTKALEYINILRNRAGITLLNESTISLEKIRNERKVELAFENHRYWDLRRWRISEVSQVNGGERFHGIKPVLHYPSKKFYFLLKDGENFVRAFRQEHYYNPITTSRINNNTSLIENPGY